MATIKGTYFYKGTRMYSYKIEAHDTDGKDLGYYISVTNPDGKTALVNWNFRANGIEESIRAYIEMMAEREKTKK